MNPYESTHKYVPKFVMTNETFFLCMYFGLLSACDVMYPRIQLCIVNPLKQEEREKERRRGTDQANDMVRAFQTWKLSITLAVFSSLGVRI
jgi:hypothetical protein